MTHWWEGKHVQFEIEIVIQISLSTPSLFFPIPILLNQFSHEPMSKVLDNVLVNIMFGHYGWHGLMNSSFSLLENMSEEMSQNAFTD